MSTIQDMAEVTPDIVEVDKEDQVDLVEIESGVGGMGSSLLQMHKEFLCVSGGAPGDDLSTIPGLDGGSPDTEFGVNVGSYKNSIGG